MRAKDLQRAIAAFIFPFLFGGTFIEGIGLALKLDGLGLFPFLFGGTFIEGALFRVDPRTTKPFPFLFGGTFIEGFGG